MTQRAASPQLLHTLAFAASRCPLSSSNSRDESASRFAYAPERMSSPAAAEAYAAKFRESGRGAKGEPCVIFVPGIDERRNLHFRPLRRPPL